MTATAPNVNNVVLGPCDVMFGTNDLGYTKGGVEVTIATTTHEVNVDQFGDTPINEYIQGRTVQVKVPMAESDLNKLVLAIPGAVLITDHTTPAKIKLAVSSSVGVSLRAAAAKLVLHPNALISSDHSQDFTIALASPSGNLDFAYNFNNERVYNVVFKGYPDATTGLLFTMGDDSASLT